MRKQPFVGLGPVTVHPTYSCVGPRHAINRNEHAGETKDASYVCGTLDYLHKKR